MSRAEVKNKLASVRKEEKSFLNHSMAGIGMTAVEGFFAYKIPDARLFISVFGVATVIATIHDGYYAYSHGMTAAALEGVLSQDQLSNTTIEESLHGQEIETQSVVPVKISRKVQPES